MPKRPKKGKNLDITKNIMKEEEKFKYFKFNTKLSFN